MGIQTFLKLGEEYLVLCEQAILKVKSLQGTITEATCQAVIHSLCIIAFRLFRSIMYLCQQGFWQEAEIMLRSLFEVTVNTIYVDIDPESRAELYLEYDIVFRKRLLDAAKRQTDPQWAVLTGDCQKGALEIETEYKKVKQKFPNKNSWSNKTVRQMAKETGMGWYYDFLYAMWSNKTHGNVRAMFDVSKNGGDAVHIMLDPDFEGVRRTVIAACGFLIRVLDIHNKVFNSFPGTEIDRLKDLLVATGGK